MPSVHADLTDTRRFLWALCYRMSGNPADADELVQETYARGLGAKQTSRPYLTRIAINLSRDLLRKRKRQSYDGPWLPAPIETHDEASDSEVTDRYDLLESVSFAFLLALEALTPAQRGVLLLVDVFDYSAHEVADVLGVSEGNVRVIHHRARKAMEAYDARRVIPTAEVQARTRAALEKFLTLLMEQDVKGIEALLAKDVRALSDGGGKYRGAVRLLGVIHRVRAKFRRRAFRHFSCGWRVKPAGRRAPYKLRKNPLRDEPVRFRYASGARMARPERFSGLDRTQTVQRSRSAAFRERVRTSALLDPAEDEGKLFTLPCTPRRLRRREARPATARGLSRR